MTHADQSTIDVHLLDALTARAAAIARGEALPVWEATVGPPVLDELRRAIDVLGAHTVQGFAQQHAYIAALSTAQEAERGRIARELHDEIVQRLVALGHSIERARMLLTRDVTAADTRLATARADVTALVDGLRAVIGDLRPPALEELGLVTALRLLLSRRAASAPVVDVLVVGTERRLAPQSELALFRIVQEAWQNTLRHAAAQQVTITAQFDDAALTLTVQDNGHGFVPPATAAPPDGHWGIRGMRERAELIGGQLHLASAPGVGTTLTVVAPYPGVGLRDPVCGMTVGPEALGATHDAQIYRFCSPACRDLFLARPAHYLAPRSESMKMTK